MRPVLPALPHLVASLWLTASTPAAQSPFTPDVDFERTLFITPNGSPNLVAPMLHRMLSAQADPSKLGGGDFAKVGLSANIGYSSATEGCAQDFRYFINRGPQWVSLPLPPSVKLADLPDVVRNGPTVSPDDDLACWATEANVPAVIAAFEWARYYNLPLTVQLHSNGPQAGSAAPSDGQPQVRDLDRWFELGGPLGPHCQQGPFPPPCPMVAENGTLCQSAFQALRRAQLQWDVADVCTPSNDSCLFEPGDASLGAHAASFATPTMVDPAIAQDVFGFPLLYREYSLRNLRDAIEQLLVVASTERYKGRLAAIAIDPEIHYPAFIADAPPTIALDLTGQQVAALTHRPFVLDYNPAVIRQFAYHLRARYGGAATPYTQDADGRSFENEFKADYLASGDSRHPHLSVPVTWEELDAPRVIPLGTRSPMYPLWHEWLNFHAQLVDAYVEGLVTTVHEAGIPRERIFTHQTLSGASYKENRHNGQITSSGGVRLYLDEWQQVDAIDGAPGVSIYQPIGVPTIPGDIPGFADTGEHLYDHLAQRANGWGSPEFNPYIIDPFAPTPQVCSPQRLDAVLQKVIASGAHVLWPFSWDTLQWPLLDQRSCRHAWSASPQGFFDISDGVPTPTAWNLTNAQWHPSAAGVLISTNCVSGSQTLTSPTINIDASSYSHIAVELATWQVQQPAGCPPLSITYPEGSPFTVYVDFEVNGTWTPHALPIYANTLGARWFVADMKANSAWSGVVSRIRLRPFPTYSHAVQLQTLFVGRSNEFTAQLRARAQALDTNGRALPPAPLALTAPVGIGQLALDLVAPAGGVDTTSASSRIKIYDCDPTGAGVPFDDFSLSGNFDPSANVACGGVTLASAVRQPPSTYLGMHKTARMRSIRLPDLSDLYLTFRVGLEGGAVANEDGVRFRVLLRDSDGGLVTGDGAPPGVLFEEHWRQHAWSNVFHVDLTAHRGEAVELLFQTHALTQSLGDVAVWGDPRLESLTHSFTSIASEDGFVRGVVNGSGEFADATSLGARALRLGDTATDRQLKAITSFDTSSIPTGATILAARLRLSFDPSTGPLVGAPLGALGDVKLELKAGGFGVTLPPPQQQPVPEYLFPSDFEAIAGATLSPVTLSSIPPGGAVVFEFDAAGLAYIQASAHFQVRCSFTQGTDADGFADYLGFYSSESSTPSALRPTLEIAYR